jgi:hypothetical protein
MLSIFGNQSIAQSQQVIGSFPNMNGGFEGFATQTAISGTASNTTQWWLQQAGNNTVNIMVGASNARTGANYLRDVVTTTATRRLHSPVSNSNFPAGTYTVQYYFKGDLDGTPAGSSMTSAIYFGTTAVASTTSAATTTPTTSWSKFATTLTLTGADNTIYGAARPTNVVTVELDDFVIYAGSEDNTAPDTSTDFVTTPASNQIGVSWTAPATGVDGGGYLVVRHTADPTTNPNGNGIYAVGNSIGSGTVVYIGTGTSFTDTGLSTSTTYYYRVYTVDKAFNYSAALSGSATTTAAGYAAEPTAQVTGLNFTSVSTSGMTINWTPAVSGGGTNHLVVIGTSLSGDPVDGSGYTANTDFSNAGSSSLAGGKVVYNGTGNSVSVTGLNYNTTYYVRVYDFNGNAGTENYLTTSPASGNQTTEKRTLTSIQDGDFKTGANWVGGVAPTLDDNAVVAHNLVVNGSNGGSCYNLTINSGAKLSGYHSNATGVAAYLNVYGNSIQVDGTLEALAGPTETNTTSLTFYQNCTLSGSGSVAINRIRPGANVTNSEFIFNADANIVNTSAAFIFDNSGNSNIGFLINNGKSVSVSGQITPSVTSTLSLNGSLTMLTGSNADFTTNYCTGTGTFILNDGATIKISAADGLNPTTGPVRCTTRNFNTAASYQFVGASAQVLGADFPATVNNLTVNNAAGVGLDKHVSISNTLTLTSGLLSLGAYDLNITSTSNINGGSATAYVVTNGSGKLHKAASAAQVVNLPIGASNVSYDPVVLTPIDATTFDVTVGTVLPGAAASGITYNEKVWNINSSTPSATEMKLTPSSAVATNIYDVIGHWNGLSYDNVMATRTENTYTTTVSTFSPFVTGTSDTSTGNVETGSAIVIAVGNNEIYVSGLEAGKIAALYGLNGQLVASISSKGNDLTFNVSKGIYLLKLQESNNPIVQKIVVQ